MYWRQDSFADPNPSVSGRGWSVPMMMAPMPVTQMASTATKAITTAWTVTGRTETLPTPTRRTLRTPTGETS